MLATAGAVGSIGTARAQPPDTGELRLFGETAVSGATEAVTQGPLAYVATGGRGPGPERHARPE